MKLRNTSKFPIFSSSELQATRNREKFLSYYLIKTLITSSQTYLIKLPGTIRIFNGLITMITAKVLIMRTLKTKKKKKRFMIASGVPLVLEE